MIFSNIYRNIYMIQQKRLPLGVKTLKTHNEILLSISQSRFV